MGSKTTIHCVACGYDGRPDRFGLTDTGTYNPTEAPQHELGLRLDQFLGRGRIKVERQPCPMPFALGMRDALRAALARVEAEIAAATGGEVPE